MRQITSNGQTGRDKEPSPYTVASSILSMKECVDAIDTIWLFLNYKTVGHIQRDDPNTWATIHMPILPNIFMTVRVVSFAGTLE